MDIRSWAREGFLHPRRTFGWQWTQDGEQVASIRVAVEIDSLRLIYRARRFSEDWRDMDYRVHLTRTGCNFGGERIWFCCPARGSRRRVAILYGGEVFACRHRYQLVYPSRREDALDRSMRRVEKLRARLEWFGDAFEGVAGRPKEMHRKTYQRLLSQLRAESRAASKHMLLRFGGDATAVQFAEALADACC